MRALGLALVASVLLLAGIQPATASSKPSKVGMVEFVAAGYSPGTSHASASASLTIRWPSASRAKKYDVFVSTRFSMSGAKRYTTSKSPKKISGLKPGKDYFFQVRGVNSSGAGSKSSRVGHTTIRSQGASKGSTYKILTYNLCSFVPTCNRTPHFWVDREAAAVSDILRLQPDVLATQEANNLDPDDLLPTYTLAYVGAGNSKRLFYRTDRFNPVRSGFFVMRAIPGSTSGKYAVWAELEDKDTLQHVIFVDVHTTAGKSGTDANFRNEEIRTLLGDLATINPDPAVTGAPKLPVVFAGDFNSHKGRSNDYLATTFHGDRTLSTKGFYDAYDLAMSLSRQHYNSYSQPTHKDSDPWVTKAAQSTKWGDHVDHIWVDPTTTRVLSWANAGNFNDARLLKPIPSDHNPVMVQVQVN